MSPPIAPMPTTTSEVVPASSVGTPAATNKGIARIPPPPPNSPRDSPSAMPMNMYSTYSTRYQAILPGLPRRSIT